MKPIPKNSEYRFDELIGNTDKVLYLLEGILYKLPGVIDIIFENGTTHNLMFKNRQSGTEFCRQVIATSKGKVLCNECEMSLLNKTKSIQELISSLCFAGLQVVGFPIILNNQLLATIIWSQFQMDDDVEGIKLTSTVEKELELSPDQLLKLRDTVASISKTDFERVKVYLEEAARFISDQIHQTIELKQTQALLQKRLQETESIQAIVSRLMQIVELPKFWSNLEDALFQLCETTNIQVGMICVADSSKEKTFLIKAVAGVPREYFIDKHYSGSDPILQAVIISNQPRLLDFDPTSQESICNDVSNISTNNLINQVALIPIRFTVDVEAVLIFFVNTEYDVSNSISIVEEMPILAQAATQIATAYLNCLNYTEQLRLSEERKRVAIERDRWFEMVSHQLIAPLNGLQANVERLMSHYNQWDEDRISSQLKATQGIARTAVRLARNFDWEVRTGAITRELTNVRWIKLRPFLIGCAIDLQGLAAKKNIRIHVDEKVNDKLQVLADRVRFYQAVENLLDNAVKYADDNTEVLVTCILKSKELIISITNSGIPINPDEKEKIFERHNRTKAAKMRVVVGTGIGLAIAKEIIELHKGKIFLQSSIFLPHLNCYEVTFTISLPTYKARITR